MTAVAEEDVQTVADVGLLQALLADVVRVFGSGFLTEGTPKISMWWLVREFVVGRGVQSGSVDPASIARLSVPIG